MSRILRHVGYKDFQKTHQRHIDEQKELAAKRLKEWQEAEVERKELEEVSKQYKIDWRQELLEAMSSKDFEHIYGNYGVSIFNGVITSTVEKQTQSTLAQDLLSASADATEYAFGSQFPGSYVNQLGGVESLSKVDVVASHDGTLPEVPEGQDPPPELPSNAVPIDTSIQGSYVVDGETRHRIHRYRNGELLGSYNFEYIFYSNPWQIYRGELLPYRPDVGYGSGYEKGWALQVYGRNTAATNLTTMNIALWQEDKVNGYVYTFRIEPVNAEGNPHLITLHAPPKGRPKNNTFEKTTDAADLGAPVAAFIPKSSRNRKEDEDSKLDSEVNEIDNNISDPDERNLIDKAKDAVLDFAAKIIGATSAKNALSSYNKFLANPKGPGSSPDNPLDITNDLTKADVNILRNAVANDSFSKLKIKQAIESSGKSQKVQDLRWEIAIGAVETAIRDASSKSEGLNNSIHGGGTLDREAFIRSGGKEITFIKPYGFRPGGSVEEFERSPLGRLMAATGLPADTIGAGGNPAVVIGGVIASQLMLDNAKKHGGIYKSPTAYMKVRINSGTMKESINFDYEGKPSPNGFPDTPPPQMINGYHPDFGKRGDMYNRLDPISAKSMPKTGDQEIDAKVSLFKRVTDKRKKSGKPNS